MNFQGVAFPSRFRSSGKQFFLITLLVTFAEKWARAISKRYRLKRFF